MQIGKAARSNGSHIKSRLKMEPHGVFKEVTKQCTNKDHYQSVVVTHKIRLWMVLEYTWGIDLGGALLGRCSFSLLVFQAPCRRAWKTISYINLSFWGSLFSVGRSFCC